MTNPLELMLQQAGLKNNQFSPNSRYHGTEVAVLESETQGKVVYVKRRFIASPEHYDLLQEHTISQEERMDNIAAQYLGDPEQFWRICDANALLNPLDLKTGEKLRITLPQGIPGPK